LESFFSRNATLWLIKASKSSLENNHHYRFGADEFGSPLHFHFVTVSIGSKNSTNMCWRFINFLLTRADKNENRKSTRRDSEKEVELKTATSEEKEVKALFDLFDNDGDR
jgi:hypothetical protein